MDLTEKTLSSEYVYEGKIIRLRVDTVLLPDGKTAKREVAVHRGAVAVVPIDQDGQIIMVRQFRYAYGEHLLEIPAGKIDEGETPEQAANRELSEEIKRKCDKLISLGVMYPAPGAQYEPVYIYLAQELSFCGGKTDEDEFLEVVSFPLETILNMILQNEIRDAKTIVGIFKYKLLKD